MSLRRIVENSMARTGPKYILGAPVQVLNDRIEFDLSLVSRALSDCLPNLNLSTMIDGFYFGDFDFLRERDIEAAFMEDAVYVLNTVTADEVVGHLLHEISHILERDLVNDLLYIDGKVEREFIQKMAELRRRLMKDPKFKSSVRKLTKKMYSPDFDHEVDQFFLRDVGYDSMSILCSDLFVDPYAASSLSEYYAIGFEIFFSKQDRNLLKAVSPELFHKLVEVEKLLTGG